MTQMNARVFVPMVPSRFDSTMHAWVPSVDLSAAASHGEVVVMLPPDAAKAGPAPCVAAMRERMKDYSAADFLLAVGDPSLLAAAAGLATRATGGTLRVLKWDRYTRNYIVVEMKI